MTAIHFLKESVAAKNIPPSKRDWDRFHAMLQYHSVGKVNDAVPIPEGGEHKVPVLHPLWAKYPIAVTKELNRGCAKGSLMADML